MNGFSQNLILWRSDMGLLMGKFHYSLKELSARHMSIFLFLYNNLSKYQQIFIKLGICIWFEIANGQISSVCDRVYPTT